MINFLKSSKEKDFWDNFVNDYSKLFYYNIRNTFLKYGYNFNQEDIDDCYGEIILKILGSKETIFKNYNEEKGKFTTYLSAICFNKTKDYMDKQKYKYNQIEKEEFEITQDQEEQSIKIDIKKILENNSLTKKELTIVKLVYLEELTSKEVAELLGVSDSTIRVTLKKALEKLRKDYR